MLGSQTEELFEELKVVDYYIRMFEDGINSRELMEKLFSAQAEIKLLKQNNKKNESKLEK